ncbi:hypothetical protein [Methanobrevibacter olleyae]|uniref:hypothetical protein n=1 Tax=Methanobrevibacter olleyae TaxID=294671 RepID=UPI0008307AF4|nr:hypothetical protein [Methanobrevibacter olleyae]
MSFKISEILEKNNLDIDLSEGVLNLTFKEDFIFEKIEDEIIKRYIFTADGNTLSITPENSRITVMYSEYFDNIHVYSEGYDSEGNLSLVT